MTGAPSRGWQRQSHAPSVQAAVEAALGRLEAGPHRIAAAGRTDSGVHAEGQVAHADLERDWEPFRLSEALNHHLKPHPVAATACAAIAPDFHARFSALGRAYAYRLVARRAPLALEAGRAWRVPRPLDLDAMREGAAHLLGHHDFTTFRSAECQAASPSKTLDAIEIEEAPAPGGAAFTFRLHARSFLHNQVRSIVGTLERVGSGAWAPGRVAEALAARDRAACGPVAPPHGLVLKAVRYEPDPFA